MDGYWFFEMLATYDDHHVSNDDDEGVTDVKKKLYIYIYIKQKDLDVQTFVSKIERL
jgi:hypothetical protein